MRRRCFSLGTFSGSMAPPAGPAARLCAGGEEVGASDGMVEKASRCRAVANQASEVSVLWPCFQNRTPLWISRYWIRGSVGAANRAYSGRSERSCQSCWIPDVLAPSAVGRRRRYFPQFQAIAARSRPCRQ